MHLLVSGNVGISFVGGGAQGVGGGIFSISCFEAKELFKETTTPNRKYAPKAYYGVKLHSGLHFILTLIHSSFTLVTGN